MSKSVPLFTIVHYPEEILSELWTRSYTDGFAPSEAFRSALRDYLGKHLTSVAMARYLLRASAAVPDSKVLFLDEKLPEKPDYLSVLTLIGPTFVLGSKLTVWPHVPHI
jgi:hypothetical protein